MRTRASVYWTLAIVLGCSFLALPAFGNTADLTIEPNSRTVIGLGATASYDVWLRNIVQSEDFPIAYVDLDFGALPAGYIFVAGPGVPDGFQENDPPMWSELDVTFDQSLLDGIGNPDLSYAAFLGPGIPTSPPAADRMLGTFWVQAQAFGEWDISLDNNFTWVSTDSEDYVVTFSDAELIVEEDGKPVVPEPGSMLLLGLGSLGALRRRRRK